MVLQADCYPSFGPQQGYVNNREEFYKNASYNNGAMRKEDYYYKNYQSGSPSIHAMPGTGFQPAYGHSSHGSSFGGGFGGYHSSSGGHFGASSHGHSMYQQHSSMSHGRYGAPYGSSDMPMGGNRFEGKRYEYQHNHSTGPYYEHHRNQAWVSKDLDDDDDEF